ncbi:hypothetical protein ACHAWF_008414 [Thalassiosira exigua]
MTATSPYAPVRRQSSIHSNSSKNGARMLRRSSSTGAVVANGTLCWFFLRYWNEIFSWNPCEGDYGEGSNRSKIGGRVCKLLNCMADAVSRNLTMNDSCRLPHEDGTGAELSASVSGRRRGISAVIHWLVNIVGGNQTKLGRIIAAFVESAREVLLRSIGATNIILTGIPTLRDQNVDDDTMQINSSSPNIRKAVCNGCVANCVVSKKGESTTNEMNVYSIRKERQCIDQILKYWFGRASPDGAQKTLWMIASSSFELLNKVDDDISEKFRRQILDLSTAGSGKLQQWTDDVEIFGWQGKIAAIIALDQMSRHVHRHDNGHQEASFSSIPKQQSLDRIAYNIARKLLRQHQQDISTGMIPLPMRIFGIMPLRHASTVQDLGTVQQEVELASALHDEMDRMIRRFRKATNRRMATLQDDVRRKGKLGMSDNKEERDHEWSDGKIIECFPFQADMSDAQHHIVIRTMSAFLSKTNTLQVSDGRFKSTRQAANSLHNKSSKGTESLDRVPSAIVSLSGGVDSMVIASALAYLRDLEADRRKTSPENTLRVIAIHIDYANRPESGAEAAYVERYCNELGIKFISRKISEVTRGSTARDDYERIAREIRFGLYRQCCQEASNGSNEDSTGIMLGHHRGDLRENVISNAHKGCGPLDLSGMTAASRNEGVTLFRPLLSLEKTCIHDYAHKYGVPYFKDTTPHWSTRGKLRNRLLPLLEEIYGEGSMGNLSSLAEESDAARALVQRTVTGPFMEKVKRYPMGITFESSPWKGCGLFLWKFVLRQLLHSMGLGMFSDKSVESFLDRVEAVKLKEGWLQCRKDYAVFLQKDGQVFILYPASFPFGNGNTKEHFHTNSKFLGYGPQNSLSIGPWDVTSDVVRGITANESVCLLQTKALRNMEHLMAGDVEYFIKVPIIDSLPCPLVRVSGFTKPTRAAAWKGFDLKVERTLPLLGVDQSFLNGDINTDFEEYGKSWTLVNVRLRLVLHGDVETTASCPPPQIRMTSEDPADNKSTECQPKLESNAVAVLNNVTVEGNLVDNSNAMPQDVKPEATPQDVKSDIKAMNGESRKEARTGNPQANSTNFPVNLSADGNVSRRGSDEMRGLVLGLLVGDSGERSLNFSTGGE